MRLLVFDLEGTLVVREDGETVFVPGLKEVLRTLKTPETFLAIATLASRRTVQFLLVGGGLSEDFFAIASADDGPAKPNPQALVELMAQCGAEPTQTVMVGDTAGDMMFAKNARVWGIGVTWSGASARSLERAGAHCVVSTPAELAAEIARLLDEPEPVSVGKPSEGLEAAAKTPDP